MSKFVHLHTHSHYSLLDGLPKIDELVGYTKKLGMDALAITDHGNLYGAVEFYKKATAAGIKPIFGVEAYIAPGDHTDKNNTPGEKFFHLTLLAENQAGWKNLIQLVTEAHLNGFYYRPRMDKELLRKHQEGLIALSGCLGGEISQALLSKNTDLAQRVANEYKDIFDADNYFIEIGHHPGALKTAEEDITQSLIALSKTTKIPLVATQDLHYLKPEDAEYHDILLAVQTANKVTDPDRLTLKEDDFSMRSPEEMKKLFKDIPEAIKNTVAIADRCNVTLELGKIKLPKFPLDNGDTANEYLEKIINERIAKRYPEVTKEVADRLKMELGVIERMGFADYFLIVQDFINWAKDRGIVVGPGRGSAAGSIVSYILGITDLDPLEYDLLFERFLNPERIQMPDIDIDITDVRRDEVLGYLRERYGEDHVAHIITFGTMAARAAIRDVGRALGMSYGFCDQIAKLIPFNQNLSQSLASITELKQMYESDEEAKRLIDAAEHLEGVARHASVHACGLVITNEPLVEHLPLQRAPQDSNVILSQFEMHAVEDLGLLKIDLLGLRNLTTIEKTVRLIEELRGKKIDISEIPLDDKKTFQLLRGGQTVGVFQLESGGMTRYLKDLKPTELEDIIAMVALYRPGPLEAGMVPQYIARKHGKEPVTYLHPRLEPILEKTYGIGVYQEQMMRIATDLGGFSLAEADTLRKAIGKKIKSLLDEQEEQLMSGMIKKGIDTRTAKAIWDLFPSFARYGFNRSHAACYAMIAYQTAYLKANYPVSFMTALLNTEAKDTERTAFIIAECKKMGIEVLPPDVNKSMATFTPENENIRFGLTAIKNVGTNIVEAVMENRLAEGPFTDLASLLIRVRHKDLNRKSLESLIKCGALDSLGTERNQALTNLDEIVKFNQLMKKERDSSQGGLFGDSFSNNSLRLGDAPVATSQEKLLWEKELLGLYVTDHPLNQFKAKIETADIKPIKALLSGGNGRGQHNIAGVVSTIKRIVTKSGQPMLFARIEDMNDSLEVVVFSDTLLKNQLVWKENNAVLISGKMSNRNGETKMICDTATEL